MIQSSGIFQSQRSSHACIILLFNSMHNAWPDPIFSLPGVLAAGQTQERRRLHVQRGQTEGRLGAGRQFSPAIFLELAGNVVEYFHFHQLQANRRNRPARKRPKGYFLSYF